MKRRRFLVQAAATLLSLAGVENAMSTMSNRGNEKPTLLTPMTLFLCGDVMLGRGIDQLLPYSSDPQLHEPYVRNAKQYVTLGEEVNGVIPKPVSFDYIWGDALEELNKIMPDSRIINLETSITTSNDFWVDKGIHYRMHPKNIGCLTSADIDCCVLANNHVLDWGYAGLAETLETLRHAGIKLSGAGANLHMAQAPAIMDVPTKGRIIVFSYGTPSSGIPSEWAAREGKAGVNFLPDLSHKRVEKIAEIIEQVKQEGDFVVISIHWGGNWGYAIPQEHLAFAHALIDVANVDMLHGHSSHHPIGMEIYKEKLILYGCGDFLNDYEGIGGYEYYRGDLSLMYFVSVIPASGKLVRLEMVPMQIKRFRLNRASEEDTRWLQRALNNHSQNLNCRIELTSDHKLKLEPC